MNRRSELAQIASHRLDAAHARSASLALAAPPQSLCGAPLSAAPRSKRKTLSVRETAALGDRRFVSVIQFERQRFLIGSSPSAITLLAQLPDVSPSRRNGRRTLRRVEKLRNVTTLSLSKGRDLQSPAIGPAYGFFSGFTLTELILTRSLTAPAGSSSCSLSPPRRSGRVRRRRPASLCPASCPGLRARQFRVLEHRRTAHPADHDSRHRALDDAFRAPAHRLSFSPPGARHPDHAQQSDAHRTFPHPHFLSHAAGGRRHLYRRHRSPRRRTHHR